MPLKGQGDFRTTVSVWCAKDQNEALDLAKAGAELEAKDCENPINEHLKVSRSLGVRGTPAIILQHASILQNRSDPRVHELDTRPAPDSITLASRFSLH